MTSAAPRSSRRDETSRLLPGVGAVAAVALAGLTLTALVLAAVYFVPLGGSANWLLQRLPITVGLALASALVAAVAGWGMAPLAAYHGATLDRALHAVVLGGHILPALWVGLALSTTLTSTAASLGTVRYVPVSESVTGWLISLALPLAVLTLGSGAALTRHLVRSCSDRLESDLVRTLLSRGLSTGFVFRRHVLPHAFPEGATLLALHFLGLLIAILAFDAVALHEVGPAGVSAPTPDVSPILIASAAVFVVSSVAYLARRALVSMRRAGAVKV